MFFGQILVPLYEDLPGDPVIPASIRNAKIWKIWKLQKKFSNYEKKLSKSRFLRIIAFFRSPKCIDVFWSNPRTPVRGFARRSGDSSKHSKCQNLKILKTSKEVFSNYEKKLSKSRFFRIIAFFRSPKCITIEDI